MKSIKYKLKKRIKSSEKLRIVKNGLNDHLKSKIYQINKIKNGIINSINCIKNHKTQNIITDEQIKKKYEVILNKNLSYLNLFTFDDKSPLISIIILNRNGVKYLKKLFKNFKKNIQYPFYEIIVVDNASTDNSINFLEDLSNTLPLKIIKNRENKSFSQANNETAKIAKGEYLLLLNNDIEPLYGWLNEMMQTALKSEDTGAVGAKLVYPDCTNSTYNRNNSFKIQHMGVMFKKEEDLIKPFNIGGVDPFNNESNLGNERIAVTAAALLVEKDKYLEVNGLDERYSFGFEDVDFCLKLHKKGYKNLYCPKALLFHYEFGTQEKNNPNKVRDRRLNNRKLFRSQWYFWLKKQIFMDKLNNKKLFSQDSFKIAFVVTETGDKAAAGDYFTALEFGEGIKNLGWDVTFLSRRGSGNWYKIGSDVDVLISMLDAYDPRKIKSANNSLIKIAWPRNWFNRWVSNPGFLDYDIIFATSKIACNYIKEKSGKDALLFPLATNTDKFNNKVSPSQKYCCDYCFTGSYWNDPREIIEMLNPENLSYIFKLYGKNWNKIKKFRNYNQGFVNYSNLPEIYRSSKIVIDDANRVTKNYGSVNSRVFDSIASETLVLNNGEIGSKETFKGMIPVYKSKEELKKLIIHYIENEDKRLAKVKELKKFVFKNHTYKIRACTLKDTLKEFNLKTKIAIKIPVPHWDDIEEWGDYYVALGLKKEFEKKGCDVLLQILPEWDNNKDSHCDVVIVLRGLSRYNPKPYHFNIMWNISHPNEVSLEEYNQYDYVLIASEIWAKKISKEVDIPVEVMFQCTDPELFYPDPGKEKYELLFVGNSRKVLRKIIRDLLPTDKDLSVYGTNWKKLINKKYIKGEHIPNRELRKAYSSCKILLNDHWDEMRDKGFISNRLFDGFASGAFIISDNIKGSKDIFQDALVTYDNPHDLNDLIEYYLDNEEMRIKKSEYCREIILKKHLYKHRTNKILKIIITKFTCN